jgi:hypothetical protein
MRKLAIFGYWLLLAIWAAGQTGLPPRGKHTVLIEDALAAAKVQGKMLLVHFTSPG